MKSKWVRWVATSPAESHRHPSLLASFSVQSPNTRMCTDTYVSSGADDSVMACLRPTRIRVCRIMRQVWAYHSKGAISSTLRKQYCPTRGLNQGFPKNTYSSSLWGPLGIPRDPQHTHQTQKHTRGYYKQHQRTNTRTTHIISKTNNHKH